MKKATFFFNETFTRFPLSKYKSITWHTVMGFTHNPKIPKFDQKTRKNLIKMMRLMGFPLVSPSYNI